MSSVTSTPGESGTNSSDMSEDEIYKLLSNQRRRFVIHALKDQQGPVELTRLSRDVTAWEVGVNPKDVSYQDRRNVYSTLRRTHLPKLDEKDIVSFDQENNVVEQAETLESLETYVEVLNCKEIPWSLYYTGLTGIVAALLLAVAAGVPLLGALTPLDVGVFTVTAFAVSSVAHYAIGPHARFGNTGIPPEVGDQE